MGMNEYGHLGWYSFIDVSMSYPQSTPQFQLHNLHSCSQKLRFLPKILPKLHVTSHEASSVRMAGAVGGLQQIKALGISKDVQIDEMRYLHAMLGRASAGFSSMRDLLALPNPRR